MDHKKEAKENAFALIHVKNTENEISVSLEGFLVAILSDTRVRKKGEKNLIRKRTVFTVQVNSSSLILSSLDFVCRHC